MASATLALAPRGAARGARGQRTDGASLAQTTAAPGASYSRIASTDPVADGILLELCEPERIVAFAPAFARADAFRFQGKSTARLDDLESQLALHPDLVIAGGVGESRAVARLREAGIAVHELGEPHGVDTLVRNIESLARLLGCPERGRRLAADFVDALRTTAADVPPGHRPRAMYLGSYGGRFFGGGEGSSYHDVLVSAGLTDAAANFRGWPSYLPEQVLQIDPDVIVTADGQRERICGTQALSRLRACTTTHGVVEVEGSLLSDPGLSMLRAARTVRTAVFGRPGATE
jgi:iron complex transport system substrate-binding protein